MKPLAISGDPKFTHNDNTASHISSEGGTLLEYLVRRALCHFDKARKTARSRLFTYGIWGACGSQCHPFSEQMLVTKFKKALPICGPALYLGTQEGSLHTYHQVQLSSQFPENHSCERVPREKIMVCPMSPDPKLSCCSQ